MAREQRKDVDYFPHDCTHGRKMHIMETKYGNDGYATWFKVLEQLGKANNHYLDISDDSVTMFLASVCRVDEDRLEAILTDLSKLGAIDKFLFDDHRVIWSQKFCDSIEDAYRKRKTKIFQYSNVMNEILSKKGQTGDGNPSNRAGMTEVIPKEEKSKEKKSKEENMDSKNPTATEKIDYKKLIDFFNANRGVMPEIKIMSEPRKNRIKSLIKNYSKEKLMEVIIASRDSKFMQGENRNNWKADFDWITKPANFIKILEGNYKNTEDGKSNYSSGTNNSIKISGRANLGTRKDSGEFA